jgi:hypothetical protein
MKKQTAVSLIAENFNLLSDKDFKSWFLNTLDYLTNLERQQIIDAYSTPLSKNLPFMDDWQVLERSEQYYTQTFTEPKND